MSKNCRQCRNQFEIDQEELDFLEQIAPVYQGKKYPIPSANFCPQCRLQRRMSFRNERALYHRTCDATGKNILSCYSPETDYIVYDSAYWWSDKWDALAFAKEFDFEKSLTEQLQELMHAVPHNSLITTNCENCHYANYLLNSRDSYLVFGGSHNESILYGKFINNCKNIVDGLSLKSCELCYEGNSSENCYNCRFFLQCRNCSDCTMIEESSGCQNCISCFGHNETVAQEYFPIDKEKAIKAGFKWHDEHPREYKIATFKIPNTIAQVPDTVINETLKCLNCQKNYRIIEQELKFYRQIDIPLPLKCHNCRHLDRISVRDSFKLYQKNCAKCGKPMETTYAPSRAEIVYCEECYLKTVY